MPVYRLFFYSEVGLIRDFAELDELDDEAAITAAERLRDGRRMELWERNRALRKWPPRQKL